MGKHLLHPEARADLIRDKAAERAQIRLSNGTWRWPYGWLVILYQENGTRRFRDAKTYEEAVLIREEEMLGDFAAVDYEKAWIVMKKT